MPSNPDAAETTAPSKLILPIVLIAVFVMPISISGTAVALPPISRDLGTDPTQLQWVLNGFNVASAIFMLVWGVLSDRIGYRATFVLGIVIMLGANVLSTVAPHLLVLDLGRILAGVGGAAVFTGAAAIMSNAYSGAARGRAFAFFGTTIGLGVALGPTIAGSLTAAFGWRGVFAVFAVVSLIALVFSGVLPKIKHEQVAGQKLVDFSLLKNKRFLAFALVPVAQAVGYITLSAYLPLAFSAVHDINPATVGLVMLPATVPVFFGPIIAAQLIKRVRRIGPVTMINAALIALVLGDLGILLMAPQLPIGWLILPMILLGFGFGFPVGLVDGEALTSVPARNSGTAAGVLNFLRLGSEAIAVAVFGLVLTALIGVIIDSPTAVAATAAGQPGHPDGYVFALRWLVIAIAVITATLTIVVNVLMRASRSTIGQTLAEAPDVEIAEVTAIENGDRLI